MSIVHFLLIVIKVIVGLALPSHRVLELELAPNSIYLLIFTRSLYYYILKFVLMLSDKLCSIKIAQFLVKIGARGEQITTPWKN